MEKLFAILGMLGNAGKDTVFKIAASDDGGSRTTLFYGLKAAIIAVLAFVILLAKGGPILHAATLPWAVPFGVLTLATYMLALRSLVSGDASTSITVFRLNFVLSTIAAAVFLGEALTPRKLAGLGFSLAAILVFFAGSRADARGARSTGAKSILLALLAAVSAAGLNTMNKVALNAGVSILHLIMYRYLVVCAICAVWLAAARASAVPSGRLMLASASCAVLMLASLFFLLTALTSGEVSVVIPISQLSFLFTAVLCWLFLGERLSAVKITGIVLAAAGISIIG